MAISVIYTLGESHFISPSNILLGHFIYLKGLPCDFQWVPL